MKDTRFTLSSLIILLVLLATLFTGCKSSDSLKYEYIEFVPNSYAIQSRRGDVPYDLYIPTEYNGYPVTHILDDVFHFCLMNSVHMETITSIYPNAFNACIYLTELDLGCVEFIGRSAFRNCRSLESVTIPETIKQIETGAFLDCEKLKSVYFKGVPEEIEPEVFDRGVTIYGPANSILEAYAYENGLKFIEWEWSAE